ncbi:hypothetical protein [Marinobacterium jannaschii]|uniref:hypothetical protein n=1 Tax=Marinobacterium jannaschii TaxID=64970 RepID=UPI0004812FD5|nr:hypothetical protein [Marinobacterium jannaschii]
MSNPVVTYTKAALVEALSKKHQGLKLEITHISYGDQAFTPSDSLVSIPGQREKEPIASFEDISATQLRMGAVFGSTAEYPVYGVGFWSGDLLVATFSTGELLTYKSQHSQVVQKYTVDISPMPTGSVTVAVGVENLNLMMAEEFMRSTIAMVRMATVQTKAAHKQMQLSERLRKLEG